MIARMGKIRAFRAKSPRAMGESRLDVPEEVVGAVRSNLTLLRQEWDLMYPENRVASEESER
jgi:hypothetical protein